MRIPGVRLLWSTAAGIAAAAGLGLAAASATAGDCCSGGDRGGGESKPAEGLLVDLANTKCPVMGGKPDGKTWSEWRGLRIGHCCPGCVAKFAKDPAALLEKAKIGWKAAADAVRAVEEASDGTARGKALDALKRKWKVLREPAAPAPQGLLVDLANAKCPVMGGKPDGKTWSEWKGLRIGHCCPGCVKTFAESPEKLLADAGIEWRDAAAAVAKAEAAEGEERARLLGALRKVHTVVREPAPAQE